MSFVVLRYLESVRPRLRAIIELATSELICAVDEEITVLSTVHSQPSSAAATSRNAAQKSNKLGDRMMIRNGQ